MNYKQKFSYQTTPNLLTAAVVVVVVVVVCVCVCVCAPYSSPGGGFSC